jgi:hypothetical protein
VTDGAREDKFIEFKESLALSTSDEKEEFLADVSSFANAAGGDLLIGMRETEGVASELRGIDIPNIDAETQRLENIIMGGIEPRIPGIVIHQVQMKSSKYAVVIRIPRSWVSPHMIRLNWNSRFYSRNSNGKYILDVLEIKQAFLLSETITERIRNFRMGRLARMAAMETPVPLTSGPKLIVHVVPMHAFDLSTNFDLSMAQTEVTSFRPIVEGLVSEPRYNFDGFLRSSFPSRSSEAISYIQIFRNGAIEAVDTYVLSTYQADKTIFGNYLEDSLLGALPGYLSFQKKLGVDLPIFVMLTLQGVASFKIVPDGISHHMNAPLPIDRPDLLVPEILIQDFDCKLGEALKPTFDAIWNASGWKESMSLRKSGK